MKTHKLNNWGLYLISVLIATVIFILIFMFARSISNFQEEDLLRAQFENSYKIFKDKYVFSQNNMVCQENILDEMSENLFFHGSIISDLEERLGKGDEKVLFQKKFYTLVLLEHLEFVRIVNEKCDYSIPTILFFYSNSESNVDSSESVGKILDYINQKNLDVKIYSFDMDLDDILIKNLLIKYNVKEAPTLVINEEIILVNPKNSEEIEKYLSD